MATKKLGSVKLVDSVALAPLNIASGSEVSGVLPVANGGTGTGTYTNGQILIGQTTGNTLSKKTVSGDATVDKDGVLALASQLSVSAGRLSLHSGDPVSNDAVSPTLYFLPYIGNGIWVPDSNGNWVLRKMPSVAPSLSLSVTSGKNYDVFIWDNSGLLSLGLSAAWTSDTVRSEVLTTKDKIYVNSGTVGSIPDQRGVHLGIMRASGTNQGTDSVTQRLLCNRYNKVPRYMSSTPGYNNNNVSTTWTTTSTTWTRANGGTGSRLEFLIDTASVADFEARHYGTSTAGSCCSGIGLDSTTDCIRGAYGDYATCSSRIAIAGCVYGDSYRYVEFMARITAAGTGTFYADSARSGAAGDPALTYIIGTVLS